MKTVEGPADLAVGDQVEVRECSHTSHDKTWRGVVTKVGKLAAQVAFASGGVAGVSYERKVRERVLSRVETRIFRPLHKLSARDLWIEQEPKGDVAWASASAGHHVRTIIVDAAAVRDSIESAISALRAYKSWLHHEPKEGT
jgi:hypothetical protein